MDNEEAKPKEVVEETVVDTAVPDVSKPGPKGIDWIKAKQCYLESFTRSYADVAKKFNVSTTEVERHGVDESWVKCRKDLGEKALLEFEENKVLEIATANTHHLSIFRNLQYKASRKLLDSTDLKTGELKALAETYRIAIEGERLILGLPTSNNKSEIIGKLTTDLNLTPDKIAEMDKFFKDEIPNQ